MSKRIGIWIRVSTEDQAQGDSPEHHELRAKSFAEVKGWTVIEIYHLEAVSGKSVINHSEAQRMLEDIRSGHISGLIFSKLARLARNTKELLEFADIFQKYDADLISLDESIDTSTPVGRFFYTLIGAMAEWERAEISSRVKASVGVRAKLGKPLGGQAPFGYMYDNKVLKLDPVEAPIRKLIFELFAIHKRKRVVSNMLAEQGYQSRKGRKISDTSIHRMLRDPISKGLRRVNYSESTGDKKQWKLKPKEEWIFNEAPRIVSDELWQTCNDILDEMAKKNTRTRQKGIHLFSGLLYCDCGSKMYMRSNHKKYVCEGCKNKIRPDDLEEIFHTQLENFLFSDIEMKKHIDEEQRTIKEKEKLLLSRQKELNKISKKLENLMELYHEGGLPKEALKNQYNEAYTKQKKIEKSILKIQVDLDIYKTHSIGNEQVLNDAQNLYKQWHTFTKEEKKSIIELITDRITIGKEDIEITLSYLPTSVPKPTQSKSLITNHNPYYVKECKNATNRQGCVDVKTLKIV